MKLRFRYPILAAAIAVYPLCAVAQADLTAEETTVEPITAQAVSTVPGEIAISPTLAIKVPDATLRTPDEMITPTGPVRVVPAEEKMAPFRPTMETSAYLAAKAAAAVLPPGSRAGSIVPLSPLAPPTLKLSFEGLNQTQSGGFFPPDTHGATGLTHFVEIVNSEIKFIPKNGSPGISKSLASFMGYFTKTLFDPRVVYDRTWNRWVITADAFPESSTVQRFFIAISTTSNPLGAYFIYKLNATQIAGTKNLFDFPQLGLDQDAIIVTANIFSPTALLGPRLVAIAKARLYNGLGFLVPIFSPQASPAFGTLAPPIVLDQNCSTFIVSARHSSNSLQLFRLRDSGRAFCATLTGPVNVPVTPYAMPPDAVQPGDSSTPFRLDTSDSRFVNASTQNGNLLWQAHCINFFGAAVRWYVINTATNSIVSTHTQFQSGNSSDFNASIAANDAGDVFLTWSSTSPTVFPQIIFDGQKAGINPPTAGTVLSNSPASLAGNFDPNFGMQRWGDYSAVSVDPTNSLRAGIVNEKVNSKDVWGSHIGLIGF